MSEEKLDKGALALRLAYDLTLKGFPLPYQEERHSGGQTYRTTEPRTFFGKASDETAIKARLEEMAEFIGLLALKLEGKA